MRRIVCLCALLLTACSSLSPDQQAKMLQAVAVACLVDGVAVPLAMPIIASTGTEGAATANADALLVHPAVVAACAALDGVPVKATPVPGTP